MSKIVFFCIPAHGHTNPTLGVVKELVNRGHEVWYYSYDTFKEKIEKAGAKTAGAGIVIEKAYQGGGNLVRDMGIRVESMAKIKSISKKDGIVFCKQ